VRFMAIKRKHVLGMVGIALLLIAGFARLSSQKAKASPNDGSEMRTVAVALVQRGPIANSLTLSGEFRPYQQVDVHAKVAGFIRQIYVDVGDKVKSGQILADLEVPELNAQVKGAEAAIRRSQDAIQRAQSDVERASSSHTAYHSAYTRLKRASEARPGLIAEQELDDSLAKDKESEAQLSSARAASSEANSQLAIAEAERNRFAALEAYSHINAPFAGVVTKRYADVGSLIQAGTTSNTQTMPVVQLAEWSRLRLVVPVPESAVPQLRLGSTVDVRVPVLNRTFQGRVARFADSLNQETRTMHTEIDVENPDGKLFDGMYAETNIVLNKKDNALTIPVQAIERNGASAGVMTVDAQGRIHELAITLGVESSDRVEVLKGLREDDRVVVGSRSEFREGEQVTPKLTERGGTSPEGGL
jgi:RND family efflux transporter MFP subunit